jgi:hypothetical protein
MIGPGTRATDRPFSPPKEATWQAAVARLSLRKEKVLGRLDKPGEVYYYFVDAGGSGGKLKRLKALSTGRGRRPPLFGRYPMIEDTLMFGRTMLARFQADSNVEETPWWLPGDIPDEAPSPVGRDDDEDEDEEDEDDDDDDDDLDDDDLDDDLDDDFDEDEDFDDLDEDEDFDDLDDDLDDDDEDEDDEDEDEGAE